MSEEVRFNYNRHGGLSVDRDSLHATDEYKRQVEALAILFDDKGRPKTMSTEASQGSAMNEALRKAVDVELPFSPYLVMTWTSPIERHSWTAYNKQQMRDYAQSAVTQALATHRVNHDALVIRLGEVTTRLEAADGLLREALPEVHSNIGWMVLQDVKDGSMESSAAVAKRITTHLKAADHA